MFETVYLGHDNTIDLLLVADGEVADITSTTRMTAEFEDTVVDSDTSSSAFDWSHGDGILYLAFGDESIEAGSYRVVLTVYDLINTNGIVWDTFKCRVE